MLAFVQKIEILFLKREGSSLMWPGIGMFFVSMLNARETKEDVIGQHNYVIIRNMLRNAFMRTSLVQNAMNMYSEGC